MAFARVAIRGLGLISTAILARLLDPEDFGLLALAMVLISPPETVSNMSADSVLIHKQDADRDDYGSVWTMRIIRGFLLALLVLAMAVPMAWWFDEPRLTPVLLCIATGYCLWGFSNIGVIDFQKNLQFQKEFYYTFYIKFAVVIVTVAAAFILRSYWALILGVIARFIITVSLSFTMSPYRPHLTLRKWREMFSFSKWLMFNNVLNFLQYRTSVVVVGSVAGPSGLGLLYLAEEVAMLASTELLTPIRHALLPGYSRISADDGLMQRGFLQSQAIMLAVAVPVAAGLGLTAHLFVPLVLGPKWIAAVPLLQCLSIAGIFQIGTANSVSFLVAKGQPKQVTRALFYSVLISVPAITYGANEWGTIGAVWGIVLGAAVLAITLTRMVCRELGLGLQDLLRACWRSLVALPVMALCVSWVGGGSFSVQLAESSSVTQLSLSLFVAISVGAASYIAVHVLTWRMQGSPQGVETRIFTVLGNALARLRT